MVRTTTWPEVWLLVFPYLFSNVVVLAAKKFGQSWLLSAQCLVEYTACRHSGPRELANNIRDVELLLTSFKTLIWQLKTPVKIYSHKRIPRLGRASSRSKSVTASLFCLSTSTWWFPVQVNKNSISSLVASWQEQKKKQMMEDVCQLPMTPCHISFDSFSMRLSRSACFSRPDVRLSSPKIETRGSKVRLTYRTAGHPV